MRPASKATPSGRNAERPCASVSAFTNSSTFNDPRSSRGAAVDFPAPLGPPSTTTAGEGVTGNGHSDQEGFSSRELPFEINYRYRVVFCIRRQVIVRSAREYDDLMGVLADG